MRVPLVVKTVVFSYFPHKNYGFLRVFIVLPARDIKQLTLLKF
mgnify:FL=1